MPSGSCMIALCTLDDSNHAMLTNHKSKLTKSSPKIAWYRANFLVLSFMLIMTKQVQARPCLHVCSPLRKNDYDYRSRSKNDYHYKSN